MNAPRSGTPPGLLKPWIDASHRQAARKQHQSIHHHHTTNPTAPPLQASSDGRTVEGELPKQRPTRTKQNPATARSHLETGDPSPTGLSPAPKQTPSKRGQDRRDLFHGCGAAAASPPPPGNTNLDKLGPNLHHRSRKHRSPSHPRPNRPTEARRTSNLAGGSTDRL